MRGRLRTWLRLHGHALFSSLGDLWRAPWMSAATILAIAITLTLPLGFGLALVHLQRLSDTFADDRGVTLYLSPSLTDDQARRLAARLRRHPAVASLRLTDKQMALAEFRRDPYFGAALDLLPDNPLPASIDVVPKPAWADESHLQALVAEWRRLPEVDLVDWDRRWLRRFRAGLALVRRAVWLLGGILSLAMVLVVGNTIRLELQERREAIAVMQLLGATPVFIRRPFLYAGFWYGAFGGGLALGFVFLLFLALRSRLTELAQLYGSPFTPYFFGFGALCAIWSGVCLGTVAAAWLTVSRHLRSRQS